MDGDELPFALHALIFYDIIRDDSRRSLMVLTPANPLPIPQRFYSPASMLSAVSLLTQPGQRAAIVVYPRLSYHFY